MGRIHRYGQREDCLIFNFAATNTIEGQVLRRLLDKLQEIRDALDDDAVFNVVGEVLPAAHVERILRDYYAGKLGDADLEDRLLESVDEGRFRNICRNALEGLASKKLNLDMLIERRARAQERRVVPETIARFLAEAARYVPFRLAWSKTVSHPPAAPAGDERDSAQWNRQAPAPAVANHASGLRPHPRSPPKAVGSAPHTFEPGRTPAVLRRYERDPDWKERLTSVLVLPHPEREAPALRHMRPNLETEATAMRVVMEHERAQGRQVYDVSEKNLGYDVTSLDLDSGELRLVEVKGLVGATGTILLTPNERRVAEDRRDCYWLYVVTGCAGAPTLQDPIPDPARFDWNEVTKVAHYYLSVNALTRPMQVREDAPSYGDGGCPP